MTYERLWHMGDFDIWEVLPYERLWHMGGFDIWEV